MAARSGLLVSNRGDISSEAGCSPGVAVYSDLYGGWFGVCGTSVSSPFSAGVIGLAGNATGRTRQELLRGDAKTAQEVFPSSQRR